MKIRHWLLLICICAGCTGQKTSKFEEISLRYNNRFDFAILGGLVVDGTGETPYQADILIQADSIVYIGQVDPADLEVQLIEAHNQIVSPGFIDTHAHGDPFSDDFLNFVSMGVTTLILGQDGRSPVSSAQEATTFFDSLSRDPILLNMGFLAGHGDIREYLGFAEKRDLTSNEIDMMSQVLGQSLTAGCLGMSTGLEYLPGSLAGESELEALAKQLGAHNKFIMSHLRSEDDGEMHDALGELLRQGKHCQVHVSHLKVVFGKDQSRAEEILSELRTAREHGVNITADVYPYMASYTGIGIVFPEWAKSRRSFERALKTRKTELRNYLQHKIMERNGPGSTLFATRPFTGKTLAQVAEEAGKDYVDILLAVGPIGASGAYFVMSEDIQETFILDSTTMICSDGGPVLRHPRSYGTFAKIIERYVLQEKKMTLENAVHKMSGLSASTLKIRKRGFLKPGYKADILIFDPLDIRAVATYENPFAKAKGFNTVFINGRIVVFDEKVVDRTAGCLIMN